MPTGVLVGTRLSLPNLKNLPTLVVSAESYSGGDVNYELQRERESRPCLQATSVLDRPPMPKGRNRNWPVSKSGLLARTQGMLGYSHPKEA